MEKLNKEELRIELIELEHEVAFYEDEIEKVSRMEKTTEVEEWLDKAKTHLSESKTRLEHLRSIVK